MRIGICGAQGTGKSTLAAALAEKLGMPLITEQARKAAAAMGIEDLSTLRGRPFTGAQFQKNCLNRQIVAEDDLDSFISDRTTLDNAVYWLKWHSHNAGFIENLIYYTQAEKQAALYDLIIYVPIEIPLEDDNFRSVNPAYQREIDYLLGLFLKSKDRHYITVQGSLEERVAQVVAEVHAMRAGL